MAKNTPEKRELRRQRAAEALKERQAAERRSKMLTIGGVVAALVLVVGVGFLIMSLNDGNDGTSAAPGSSTEATGDASETAYGASSVTDDFGFRYGATDAPHELVIYEDFLCPFCGQLELALGDQLDQAVRDGKISVEFRPLNFLSRFGDYSGDAANAMAVVYDVAGPDVAKEFHDLVYEEQPEEGGDLPGDDWLVEKAVEAGAEESAVRPGIEDDAFEGWVEDATDAGSKAGINSTPTVKLDGEDVEGATIGEMASEIFAAAG